MSPSKLVDGVDRGWIIPIGGAEGRDNDPRILSRFVKLCGGRDADIVILPTASRLERTGPNYEQVFLDLDVKRATSIPFDTRRDCAEGNRLDRIREASGIFFTGGNQLRLSTILGGTPVAKLIRNLNAAGVHVAGTSAGASFLSEHMIAFGDEGTTPTAGKVSLAPGLGLTNRFVIDQHFRQRDRLGRLLSAQSYNPFALGIGLDEDTAAFIGPDDVVEVVGAGAVTVVDSTGIEFSSMDLVAEGEPVCMLGIVLHILVEGATFNLHTKKASAGSLVRTKE